MVLDVQVGAVRPGSQHGFLNHVLGAMPITLGQHGGQPQQRLPVLGVQAAERGVRVLVGASDALIAEPVVFLRRTPRRGRGRAV